ncbi:MAG: hypothetical protein FWH11_14195 [Micrococcales bacterium]|nr:hypothetical protein [Micrococcales bacterium]
MTVLGGLAATAALAVAVEVPVMALAGYRRAVFLAVCALVNLGSNLALNLTLTLAPGTWRTVLLPMLEAAVVVVEWAVLRLVVDGPRPPLAIYRPSARLAVVVLVANLTSLAVGFVLL